MHTLYFFHLGCCSVLIYINHSVELCIVCLILSYLFCLLFYSVSQPVGPYSVRCIALPLVCCHSLVDITSTNIACIMASNYSAKDYVILPFFECKKNQYVWENIVLMHCDESDSITPVKCTQYRWLGESCTQFVIILLTKNKKSDLADCFCIASETCLISFVLHFALCIYILTKLSCTYYHCTLRES